MVRTRIGVVLAAGLAALFATAMAAGSASAAVSGAHSTVAGLAQGDRISLVHSDAVRPAVTDLTADAIEIDHADGEFVIIVWGFDYSPADNHLRAYGEMDPSNSSIHTQAQPLALGDNNGVLKTASINSQSGGFVLETDAVGCHKPSGLYNSNLHFNIRWADGQLHGNDQTGEQSQHQASVICT